MEEAVWLRVNRPEKAKFDARILDVVDIESSEGMSTLLDVGLGWMVNNFLGGFCGLLDSKAM